jgi:curli biogenesis system outer membrane secretion channel CsgG
MWTRVRLCIAFGVLLAAGRLALPALADDAWKPHLENKNGEAKELGDPKALKDGDWLEIQYGPYSGYKSRLAVVVSEEKTAYTPEYKSAFKKMIVAMADRPKMVPNPQNYIEDLVRQALTSTNRFELLERTTATADIAAEQALGDSGRVDTATAVPADRITGAEYLVKATLIELNPEKDTKEVRATGGAAGNGAAGFGDLGVKTKVAFCRLSLRVIRVETGEIVSDQMLDGTCTTAGLTGVTGFGLRAIGGAFKGKSKKEAPITNAMQTCANKAAYYAATSMGAATWIGTVADVTDRTVTIAAGTAAGLHEGVILTLISRGADIVDPNTQEVIGSENKEIGQVRIVSTQERFSTGEIIQGGEGAKKGDLVRRESPKP